MVNLLKNIQTRFGDSAFTNASRTNALLLDLAPGMNRERIQIRNFVEINGYRALQQSGDAYPLARAKLIQMLTDQYCVDISAAAWTVDLFAAVLGYITDSPPVLGEASAVQMPEQPPITVPPNGFVAIGNAHTVAVSTDGTVWANGKNDHFQCDVSGWQNIIAVAAGNTHTVGLCADGRVVATGSNIYDQCDVYHFTHVADIYAYGHDTICVRKDGTAAATGQTPLDLSHFTDIRGIARFPEGVLGLRGDGTVAVARRKDALEPAPEEQWARSLTDAVQIVSTYIHGSVVLKSDGRIYKMGEPDNYFSQWNDILSIMELSEYLAVLRRNGQVRLVPFERTMPRLATAADHWQHIKAIYGKYKRLVGLTARGSLLSACTDPEWERRNGNAAFLADWYPAGPGQGQAT